MSRTAKSCLLHMWAKLLLTCVLLKASHAYSSRRNVRFAASCSRIEAAVCLPHGKGTYFLSGSETIKRNREYGVEEWVKDVAYLGVSPGVQAAVTFPDNTVYYFRGCSFQRFNVSDSYHFAKTPLPSGSLADLGLPCDVDAAVTLSGEVLVFKDCEIYKYNVDRQRFQADSSTLTSSGLPCQLDSAVEWTGGSVLAIKGSSLWQMAHGRVEGPLHSDLLGICSWYLCGEADWMLNKIKPSQGQTVPSCNGDERLCPLRLNQVTLPGLHNAGAGFAGGFSFFLNCWMRNHGQNITQQLRNGIRHLDVDPCFDTCGILGTCHAFSCGGSLCSMIKQIREFLRDYRHDVVTVNFNHEMKNADKVIPALTRQLETQLGPVLNSDYRKSDSTTWPTLKQSIRANERVFVFYAPIIDSYPIFARKKWIHNEADYKSTWRPFGLGSGCGPMVDLTSRRCYVYRNRPLVEVSVIAETAGSCLYTNADACRPYMNDMLKACQDLRFLYNSSPNVLLVDWPERRQDGVNSVFNAVKYQNVRNIAQHRDNCTVKIDAAVTLPSTNMAYFFVGQNVLVYDLNQKIQLDTRSLPPSLISDGNITAAYFDSTTGRVRVYQGCSVVDLDPSTLTPVEDAQATRDSCTPVDAATVWQGQLHTFSQCHVDIAGTQTSFFLCDVDAVLTHDGKMHVFKGSSYYTYVPDQDHAALVGDTLNSWTMDAVLCS